jgi:hypothetical protein
MTNVLPAHVDLCRGSLGNPSTKRTYTSGPGTTRPLRIVKNLFFILYSLFAFTAYGTTQYVQGSFSCPQTPQQTVGVESPNPQVPADTNIVAVGWNDTTAMISRVTDSNGNKSLVFGSMLIQGNLSQAIYYATGVKGGSDTITVKFTARPSFADIRVCKYSGLNGSIDVSAGATGSNSIPAIGVTSTSNASDLLFVRKVIATVLNSHKIVQNA